MENRLSSLCDRVIEAGWLASAAIIPLFFNIFSSRVFEPDKLSLLRSIVLVMGAAWFIRLVTLPRRRSSSGGSLLRASPLTLPALLFLGVYVISTAFSLTPRVSFWGSYVRLQGLASYLSYVGLFFMVGDRLRTREQLNRLVLVILLTSVPISIYGIVQHFKMDPLPWGGDVTFRVTSTMGNAIFLAAYLIMVVPLTMAWLAQRLSDLKSIKSVTAGVSAREGSIVALVLLVFLQLVAILLTLSRGPWIGLAAGLLFMGLVWLVRLRRGRAALGVGVFFAAFLAFVMVINIANSPLEPLKKLSPYLERLGTISDMESGTNRVRTLIWFGDKIGRGAAGLITENPLRAVIGHGPESMYVAYNPYYPPDLAHLEARNATPDRSHNDLLDYLVITGFFGLFAYLLVMVRAFSIGLQALWSEKGTAEQAILVGIMGALAAHVVESLTGIAIASSLTYTWLFLGCLVSLVLRPSREASATVAVAVPVSEARSARRRRPARKTSSKPEAAPMTSMPWLKSPMFYGLVGYLVVSAFLTFLALWVIAPRDPEPVPLVVGFYFWLLIGILVVAAWVGHGKVLSGERLRSQTIILAIVIGLIAVGLPIKLFLGGVIADIYFKKGQNLAASQRFDMSVGPFLDAIQWEPDQDYYYLFLGQAYLELARTSGGDRPPQRIQTVNDLLKFKDRSVVQLGRENLMNSALVTLSRAKELNPLNTDHSANLGRLYRLWGEMSNDASIRQQKWQQALEYYKQATTLSPNAAHLRAEWGLIYYFLGDLQSSQQQYSEAMRLDPGYSPTYAYLGDLYRTSGNEDASLDAYRKALEVNAQAGGLLPQQEVALHGTLGQLYYQKGLLQESLAEDLKVVQLAPKDYLGHKNLAFLYQQLGNPGKAIEEARLALPLAPAEDRPALQAFITGLEASPR